jgi:hypothetical protein
MPRKTAEVTFKHNLSERLGVLTRNQYAQVTKQMREEANVSESLFFRYLAGKRNLTLHICTVWANILGITVSQLLDPEHREFSPPPVS